MKTKTLSIIKSTIFLIGLTLVVGYYFYNRSLRNVIQFQNVGSASWNKIELEAGERYFKIDHFDSGESKKFTFHSRSEGGGIITGYIGQNISKSKFGYFTPNLSEKVNVILNDDGSIVIKDNF